MQRIALALALLFTSSSLLAACSNPCGNVCERRKECFDPDLDVDACTSECQDASEDNDDHNDKAIECSECVSDRTCGEILEQCLDDCFGVAGG